MNKPFFQNTGGFTLLEMMITVTILGTLIAITAQTVPPMWEKFKNYREIGSMHEAVNLFESAKLLPEYHNLFPRP